MSSTEKLETLSVLKEALEALLDSHIGVVEASRIIAGCKFPLRQENNSLFTPFVGIDSETDMFPVGAVRKLWAPEAIELFDKERELAEQHFGDWAMQSAKALLDWARCQEF
jgi:hypothetical protein